MTELVVDLDEQTVENLQRVAVARGRTLEQTVQDILRGAAAPSPQDLVAEMDRIRAMTPRRLTTDSVTLIHEGRAQR